MSKITLWSLWGLWICLPYVVSIDFWQYKVEVEVVVRVNALPGPRHAH